MQDSLLSIIMDALEKVKPHVPDTVYMFLELQLLTHYQLCRENFRELTPDRFIGTHGNRFERTKEGNLIVRATLDTVSNVQIVITVQGEDIVVNFSSRDKLKATRSIELYSQMVSPSVDDMENLKRIGYGLCLDFVMTRILGTKVVRLTGSTPPINFRTAVQDPETGEWDISRSNN